jgi:THO complex subunit 4
MALDDLIKSNKKKEPRAGGSSRRGGRNAGGGNGRNGPVSGPTRRSNFPRSRPSPYFIPQARQNKKQSSLSASVSLSLFLRPSLCLFIDLLDSSS